MCCCVHIHNMNLKKLRKLLSSFFFLCYNWIVIKMKIAIDKESLSALKNDGNEYVYLFYNEPYSELKQLGLHCIRWNMCDYVDVNLTQYVLFYRVEVVKVTL